MPKKHSPERIDLNPAVIAAGVALTGLAAWKLRSRLPQYRSTAKDKNSPQIPPLSETVDGTEAFVYSMPDGGFKLGVVDDDGVIGVSGKIEQNEKGEETVIIDQGHSENRVDKLEKVRSVMDSLLTSIRERSERP